jgi:hypothetical protein
LCADKFMVSSKCAASGSLLISISGSVLLSVEEFSGMAHRLREIETFRLNKSAGVALLHRAFVIEERFKVEASWVIIPEN